MDEENFQSAKKNLRIRKYPETYSMDGAEETKNTNFLEKFTSRKFP